MQSKVNATAVHCLHIPCFCLPSSSCPAVLLFFKKTEASMLHCTNGLPPPGVSPVPFPTGSSASLHRANCVASTPYLRGCGIAQPTYFLCGKKQSSSCSKKRENFNPLQPVGAPKTCLHSMELCLLIFCKHLQSVT